jgi:hypothetical protein
MGAAKDESKVIDSGSYLCITIRILLIGTNVILLASYALILIANLESPDGALTVRNDQQIAWYRKLEAERLYKMSRRW